MAQTVEDKREYSKQWRAANAAKHKAYMKEWRAKNAEKRKAYQKEWKAKNAEQQAEYQRAYMAQYQQLAAVQRRTWERHLMGNYGLTPKCFNALWEKQSGKCAICEATLKPRGRDSKSVSVDHNHTTGEVRGLLCRSCNRGLGYLKDNPDVLKAAARYLIENGNYSLVERN